MGQKQWFSCRIDRVAPLHGTPSPSPCRSTATFGGIRHTGLILVPVQIDDPDMCNRYVQIYMLDISRYEANSDPDMEHGSWRNFLDMCAFSLNARFTDTSQVRSGHTWRPGLGCSLASLLSLAQSSHNELFQLGVLHLLYITVYYG